MSADELHAAKERALALTFDEYAGTVVPYLQEEIAELYGSAAAWTDRSKRPPT